MKNTIKNAFGILLILAATTIACKKKKVTTLPFSAPAQFQIYAHQDFMVSSSASVLISSDSIKSFITFCSNSNDSLIVLNADTCRLYAPLAYIPVSGGWPIYVNAAKDSLTISEKLGGVGTQHWRYSLAKKI